MTAALTNHLWQSTIFAIAVGLLSFAFRSHRAEIRFWLWLSASLKFFVPFSLLIGLGSQVHIARKIAVPQASMVIEQVTEPFPETVSLVTAIKPTRTWLPIAMTAAWSLGLAAIGFVRFRGWLRIRAAVRSSVASNIRAPVQIRSSPGLLEPGVVGLFKQVLLLPAGIEEHLTARQLNAVLAHELCHVRRRDNLFASIHMIVEAIFWFHPLVWWIGARLVEERERACDEAVLGMGGEPQDYAEAILNVCKLYVESPLVCVSGVTGADLKKRIEAIMTNRVVLSLTFAKKAALGVIAMAVLAAPFIVGILNLPKLRAQVAVPAWEVASIKSCGSNSSGGFAKGGGGRNGGGGGGAQGPSPDRLNIPCQPLSNIIRTAYLVFADGHRTPPMMMGPPIEGGPNWVANERYQITAKAEGTPGQDMMRGPMLQALLEDRFKLKVRRESREVPAYALTVAKNGPKLQPFKEGGCWVMDFSKPLTPPTPEQEKTPICTFRMIRKITPNGPVPWEVHGGTLDDLARALSGDLDRIVINKTGITGKYDYHLEFGADETTAGLNRLRGPDGPVVTADPTGGVSIFTAIQAQLGLKLEPSKGQREFLVIDRVEKPSEN